MKKIGLISTLSPFYGSKILSWRIHDSLLYYSSSEIIAPMPVGGGQQFADRLYSGDDSVLYPTLRRLNIQFRPMDSDIEVDALLIDSLGPYSDTAVRGCVYSDDEQSQYFESLVEKTLARGGTVVFIDVDGWSLPTHSLDGDYSEYLKFWNRYKSHPKVRMMTNFEHASLVEGKQWVIPFEVDIRDYKKINPLRSREVLLSYIGHQYHRLGILPVLDSISKYGSVKVYGSGWSPHQNRAPRVEFLQRVPATHDSIHRIYGNSKLGIITYRDCDREQRLRLYLLRWRELAIAGVLILIENDPFFKDILGPVSDRYTIDRFLEDPTEILSMSDTEYIIDVDNQRRWIEFRMGVPVLEKKFKEALFG